MTEQSSFELVEIAAFSGITSWELTDNHLRLRRTNGAGTPLPFAQPIPVGNTQIATFVAALHFLDVWNWKANYDPSECGCEVYDGMSWSFNASIDGRNCNSGGSNAFPSFTDPQRAALDSERYGFLIFAFRSAFGIDFYERISPDV